MGEKCKDCAARKFWARVFDMHFWLEDCPYNCPEKQEVKNEQQDI